MGEGRAEREMRGLSPKEECDRLGAAYSCGAAQGKFSLASAV